MIKGMCGDVPIMVSENTGELSDVYHWSMDAKKMPNHKRILLSIIKNDDSRFPLLETEVHHFTEIETNEYNKGEDHFFCEFKFLDDEGNCSDEYFKIEFNTQTGELNVWRSNPETGVAEFPFGTYSMKKGKIKTLQSVFEAQCPF